jgi:hypothetical protein
MLLAFEEAHLGCRSIDHLCLFVFPIDECCFVLGWNCARHGVCELMKGEEESERRNGVRRNPKSGPDLNKIRDCAVNLPSLLEGTNTVVPRPKEKRGGGRNIASDRVMHIYL